MKIKKQNDLKDCGLVVFQALFYHYNKKWISLFELKKSAFFSDDGIVIKNLQNLAFQWGIELEAYNIDFETLKKEELNEPVILLINENDNNHYVILENKNKKYFYIADPLIGNRKIKINDFEKMFVDIIIFPNKIFNPEIKNTKNWIFTFLNKKEHYFLFFSILLVSILHFSSAFFLKTVIEKILPFNDKELLFKISFIFLWIFLFKFSQNIIKNIYIKKLQNNIEYKIIKNFLFSIKQGKNSQLLKLEISDYIKRFSIIPGFSFYCSHFLYSFFGEMVSFVFSTVVLYLINKYLFIITLIIGIFFILISFIYKKIVNKKYNILNQKNIEFNSSFFDIIKNIEKIKNKDINKMLQFNIEKKLNDYKKEENFIWKINYVFQNAKNLLSEFLPIFSIFISSLFVINKNIQIGTMILFITFISNFLNPLNSLTDLIISYPIFINDYDLLKFILFLPKEKNGNNNLDKINTINLNNINYKYNNLKTILKIENFEIKENIHIIGNNGTGKSTLLKILNLDLELEKGIYFNNLALSFLNKNFLRNKIIYISGNTPSIDVTVYEFIIDKNSTKEKVFVKNIEYYDLTKMLEKWKINLNQKIKNDWSNFSLGQKQIILLLKLFNQKYDLILLDEAFENISDENFDTLKILINDFQNDAIFVEVSHSHKFIKDSKKINVQKL
ncbi:Mbov_0121 family peptidase domain-containing ABC transporter [Mesomycoplasma neurolyticum]|uniref:ABC transporter ATP-binding protein n=1 Tax=Mesomycoplasma neurolyticum TaxID=2120 RepID=A0A449A4S8_9BACT|nr:cysteine peptidase family C39 domain-containing protein [Mesomycoplasma neurolyticum]VEU59173.1 ABC transporter ATP-binding protein [Mesomycoplasma neurolyticum]